MKQSNPFICKAFQELTTLELYQILKLRSEVFVVEQNCIYLDMDDKDLECYHILGYEGDKLCSTARIVPVGLSYPMNTSIGRVCNHSTTRNTGKGKELMHYTIHKCLELFPHNSIRISAQSYLIEFYTRLGFQTTGKEYLEDNIPHTEMLLIHEETSKSI